MSRLRVTLLAVVLGLGAASWGCTSPDEPVGPAAIAEATDTTASPTTGTPGGAAPSAEPAAGMVRVRGYVRLAAGSELPAYTLEQIGRDATRPGVGEGCSPARASDVNPMNVTADRGVGGVMVTATGHAPHFAALPAVPPRTIPLRIRDCRLTPTLLVAAVGDVIELTNDSPLAFITKISTDPVNEAQATGRSRRVEITRPGIIQVECILSASCGRAEVVVLGHRVATVTDETGRFELDVPAGAEVALHAWHPLLRRREGEARLTIDRSVAGRTETVDIQLAIAPEEATQVLGAPPATAPAAPTPSAPAAAGAAQSARPAAAPASPPAAPAAPH